MDREQDGQGAEWIKSGKDREWGGRETGGGGGEWGRWRRVGEVEGRGAPAKILQDFARSARKILQNFRGRSLFKK